MEKGSRTTTGSSGNGIMAAGVPGPDALLPQPLLHPAPAPAVAGPKGGRIAAAATLSPASQLKYFGFLLLAIFVQLNWGLFGVSTRFLQVHASRPVPSLQLCVVMTAVSWAGLLVFYTIPAAIGALISHIRHHLLKNAPASENAAAFDTCVAQAEKEQPPQEEIPRFDAAGAVSDCASFVLVLPRGSFVGSLSNNASSASFVRVSLQTAPTVKARGRLPPGDAADAALSAAEEGCATTAKRPGHPRPSGAVPSSKDPSTTPLAKPSSGQPAVSPAARRASVLKSLLAATIVGTLVALQGLTLLYASRFVFAYVVQLVFLLTPLVTAIANKFVLRQNTPRALAPALAAALAGSALVITGNYTTYGKQAGGPISPWMMGTGLALAVVSMLLLAAYLVALQVTQHIVTGVQVMYANVVVGLVLLTPVAVIAEGLDWSWIFALTPFDWGVMFFAAFWIDAVNTILTQTAIRVVGSAVMSLFICCRLASSVAGSVVLLHEVPKSPLTFSGFGLVALALTGFMGLQLLDRMREQRAAAAEAASTDEALKAADEKASAACEAPPLAGKDVALPFMNSTAGRDDDTAAATDAAERGEA